MEQRSRGWSWQVIMGIPIAFYATGIGLAVSGGTYFWPGIIIGFIATIILALSCWIESRTWTRLERIIAIASVAALFGVVAWISFHPAPINVSFELRSSNYPKGTKIAGIEWADDLTDLRATIRNETGDDYSNLDITISTDLVIAGIGAITDFGSCTFSAPSNVKFTELRGVDERGNKITIPFVPVPNVQPIASIYRMHCDKLIARSDIEIVLALISFHFGANNPVGPRTNPSWVSMEAEYDVRGRPRRQSYFKCFADHCDLHAQ